MVDNFLARMLLRWGYRSRSLAANERQFSAAVAEIDGLVSTATDAVLRGRRPIKSLPGVTATMQSWSASMTIDHVNGVHEAMLELIRELEADFDCDVGDIGRFDHPPSDCGPEVMPRFRDLAGRIARLPQSYPFTGRGTFLHPIFGRLTSRNAYALLAFHVRLHVPHVRHSIEVNAGS